MHHTKISDVFSTELEDKMRRLDSLIGVKNRDLKNMLISHNGEDELKEVIKLESEIEELKQQMTRKKLQETERLVRELRNPNPEIKI